MSLVFPFCFFPPQMVSTQFSREANNVHRLNDGSRCYCNPKFIKFSALVLLSLPFPFPFLIHHLSSSSTSNKTIKLTIVRTWILDETGAMARQFEGEMGSLELFNDSIALAENEAENDKGGGGGRGIRQWQVSTPLSSKRLKLYRATSQWLQNSV